MEVLLLALIGFALAVGAPVIGQLMFEIGAKPFLGYY